MSEVENVTLAAYCVPELLISPTFNTVFPTVVIASSVKLTEGLAL
jgi:hypothetical protein